MTKVEVSSKSSLYSLSTIVLLPLSATPWK